MAPLHYIYSPHNLLITHNSQHLETSNKPISHCKLNFLHDSETSNQPQTSQKSKKIHNRPTRSPHTTAVATRREYRVSLGDEIPLLNGAPCSQRLPRWTQAVGVAWQPERSDASASSPIDMPRGSARARIGVRAFVECATWGYRVSFWGFLEDTFVSKGDERRGGVGTQ